jgi:hypothetical protein
MLMPSITLMDENDVLPVVATLHGVLVEMPLTCDNIFIFVGIYNFIYKYSI